LSHKVYISQSNFVKERDSLIIYLKLKNDKFQVVLTQLCFKIWLSFSCIMEKHNFE